MPVRVSTSKKMPCRKGCFLPRKGPLSGNSLSEEEFQEALQIYYAMMNWNERAFLPEENCRNWDSTG